MEIGFKKIVSKDGSYQPIYLLFENNWLKGKRSDLLQVLLEVKVPLENLEMG